MTTKSIKTDGYTLWIDGVPVARASAPVNDPDHHILASAEYSALHYKTDGYWYGGRLVTPDKFRFHKYHPTHWYKETSANGS